MPNRVNTYDLRGKTAIITGGAGGFGVAIAEVLLASGATVCLWDLADERLRAAAGELRSSSAPVTWREVDITDERAIDAALEADRAQLGRLDILVNNAGITKDGLALRMSDEDWGQVLQVNLTSAFVAIRAAARSMMRGKFGRIVNISSTSGVVGNAGQANYAAAKSGLIGFSKSVARELGSKGITCNVVAPGFIETDMTANLPQQVKDGVMQMMAVKRFGTSDDIAAAVSYVTGDEAGFLTGQTICVDGGMTMC